MQTTAPTLRAVVGRLWCSIRRSHYLVINGTGTALDGTILATPADPRPYAVQVRANVAEVNARRAALGLPEVVVGMCPSALDVDPATVKRLRS